MNLKIVFFGATAAGKTEAIKYLQEKYGGTILQHSPCVDLRLPTSGNVFIHTDEMIEVPDGFHLIYLHRPGGSRYIGTQKFDATIDNDGSLNDLYERLTETIPTLQGCEE